MYTNNYYYKLICETLIGEQIEGHHPDIYYLELILEYYDVTYQTVKCKGKYLKDWYIALTHQTVSKSHPNLYYLRLIANFLTNTVLPWRTENYYLRLISENHVTVQLVADPSTIELGESTTLTATVLDANREPIGNASVTIYNGESSLVTDTTDENGQIEYTYTPSTAGEYGLYAKYLNSQSSQIEVNVTDPSTNLTVSRPVNDTRVTPTDTVSVGGYLEDNSGNRLSDKTIKVKLGSTVLATTTTGSIGVYSTSFNASSLSDGSNTITITFEGDSSHNSSTVTRTVIREVYQITLSEANNKTILSYADSDTASLQATLTHGGVAVPDNPITFFTGVANTYNTQTRLNEDWNNGFKIRIEGTSERLMIGNGTSTEIYYYSELGTNNVRIITNGQKVANFNCGDWLKYDNGVLYGSNGNSLDISSYNIDFTKNYISGGTLYRDVIGVSTTDNTGKATITYNSQGIGDIGFKAGWSTFVSETYSILDAKYYADNTKINSYMSAFDGHQCAFIPYTVQYGDEVSFKFNTKPTHCLIGIGTSSSSCLVMEFNTNSTKIHRSYGGGSSYNVNWLDTYSKMGIHMTNLSSSEDKSEIYRDDVYVDYWRCQLRTTNNALRVEKFNNDDYDIEIIIL